jgi:hypothetical protein
MWRAELWVRPLMSMVAKLQESLQATVTLHQKATKDSNQINMLSVSVSDRQLPPSSPLE